MKAKTIILGVALSAILVFSCKDNKSNNRQRNQGPPSTDQIFKQLDENEDEKLSEKEVKGPLKEMFSKIDTNEDGFLSNEEVEKAPKPQGQRPNQ